MWERERESESERERSLSIYTHVPSSQLLGTLLFFSPLFFCIEDSVWVSSRFKRQGRLNLRHSGGEVSVKEVRCEGGAPSRGFAPSPPSFS